MANDNTFDPSQDIGRQSDRQIGNLPVTSPFEPGSVNKIVTAAAAIEYDLTNPDEVRVPGSINMGGVNVRDAWGHGVMPYTTTGVFRKSSNVGTLMLAQRVGPERYYDMLGKFGLGQRTASDRRRERRPGPAHRPVVGQHVLQSADRAGLSMTLLQMAGMYQAIANDGVRDSAPHRQGHHRAPDGTCTETPRPNGIQVVNQGPRGAAQHAPRRRPARPDGRSAGHRPSRRRRRLPDGRARPAPPSRSTRAAAAATTTSTGSPSPAWRPPTIPATSSGSWMDAPPVTQTAPGALGRAAVPQHRRLADAARERPASPDRGRC